MNPVSYLTQSGRSIISNEAEKIEKHGISVALDDVLTSDIENIESTSSEIAKLSHLSLQDDLEASQSKSTIMEWIEKIQQLFKGDKDASCFIEQKIAEQKKSRILIFCKFTDQVYRNVEKRIKSKVRKRFPNGFPWWEIES